MGNSPDQISMNSNKKTTRKGEWRGKVPTGKIKKKKNGQVRLRNTFGKGGGVCGGVAREGL